MPAKPKPPTHSHPTFLFTDIEDSSRIVPRVGYSVYRATLQPQHDAALTEEIARYHGEVDGTAGDSFLAIFPGAEDAVACAVAIQKRLHDTPAVETDRDGKPQTIAVRIGVHTAVGEALRDPETGYRSHPDVNFASRVMSNARGGQILVSQETHRAVLKLRPDRWEEWPDRWIKSFEDEPQTLYELLWDGGETRGEPGLRWLPATFRAENSRYVPRPELETKVRAHFATRLNNGERARMVTLWGYGGMGKTRMAIACALKSVGAFKDGVYFVSLADRPPSAQVIVEGIGAAIKEAKFARLDELLPEKPATLEDLLPALREKSVLLVLDNYESVHCPEAQAFLRDLLRETRHLRLLLTSRESVHLEMGEKEMEVAGLTDKQARELFVERARLKPGRDEWEPATEREESAMRRILTLSERIPLALELLAAWMGLREIAEIADELERTPLPALPEGHDHLDPSERHQSLEKCLEYSYLLLREPFLQRGLSALSLFADSFNAESVSGACGIAEAQRLLDRLWETALLTRYSDEGRSRYAMLRPTRAYASDRFNALPDSADLRTAYISYYRQLAIDNDNINDLGKQTVLEREWRNALAAADHTEAAGDDGSLNILSTYLGEFLLLRGWWSAYEGLNRRALEAVRCTGDRQEEGRALHYLGVVYGAQGKWQEAIDCYQQSLVIRQECGDRLGEGKTLSNLGIVYQAQGKWQEAMDCYEQDLAICREYGDRVGEGASLHNLGAVYGAQGKWQEAMDCNQQSLVIRREYGDQVGEGKTLGNQGVVHRAQGKWQEAIDCYQQSLAICREYGDWLAEGRALNNLGNVYQEQGKWQEAMDCYQQSLVIKREYGDRLGEGQTLGNLGNIYQAQGKWQEAMDCYEQDLAICREYSDRVGEGASLENIATLYNAQGDTAKALEWERQALQVLETTEDRRAIEKARSLIAEWAGK
jgi:tetratricopeptide (TPR) repeat protein/class 3 adenylate cyclase